MQNTFYFAENTNTHKQTARGTCKGARRKNPNQTHSKQKACGQLLFLQEPDLCKCSEPSAMLTTGWGGEEKEGRNKTQSLSFGFLNLIWWDFIYKHVSCQHISTWNMQCYWQKIFSWLQVWIICHLHVTSLRSVLFLKKYIMLLEYFSDVFKLYFAISHRLWTVF